MNTEVWVSKPGTGNRVFASVEEYHDYLDKCDADTLATYNAHQNGVWHDIEACGYPHARCTRCGRYGEPYEYRGLVFDGLCPYRGERLCPSCRDAAVDAQGVQVVESCRRCGKSRVYDSREHDPDAVTPRAWNYRCCNL